MTDQHTVKAEGNAGQSAVGIPVRNAIILAAGMSRAMAPLSFEKPKAMFEVRGQVLIERLVGQLHDAGITDISVVVGYMKEEFFYLEHSLGVKLIFNGEYADFGSYRSLWYAREILGDSYVLASDEYFLENPFKLTEPESFCTITHQGGDVEDLVAHIDSQGCLAGITMHGSECDVVRGPAFLDKETAQAVIRCIEEDHGKPGTAAMYWEQVLASHSAQIHLKTHRMRADAMCEFDRLTDLLAFDGDFLQNVDSGILDNICECLGCKREDVHGVKPLKAGLTNLSTLFYVGDAPYIYRHPGPGTEKIINRQAESFALRAAARLGIDDTLVAVDPHKGWKISRYIGGCRELDYGNREEVARALGMARQLHESGEISPWSFDFYDGGVQIVQSLKESGYPIPRGFDELMGLVGRLAKAMRADAGAPVLCHNDFYGPNFLVQESGQMRLIDWEYAAMGDAMCDIGNFVAQGSGYTIDQTLDILPLYLGHKASRAEERHCLAAVAVVGWYWYVWAMYKGCTGNPVGEWLHIWHQSAMEYSAVALERYGLAAAGGDAGAAGAGTEAGIGAGARARERILTRAQFDELEARFEAGETSPADLAALEPYRAKRAVLLASGFGSRMLPVTLNTPKPLVNVNGRRIIESILDALLGIGITECYIVTGYLGYQFEALKKDYPGVRIISNPIYDRTNNISSALAACEHMASAYVFESDLLIGNPQILKKYRYESCYYGTPLAQTSDWAFDVADGYVTDLHKGGSGEGTHIMHGISFWTPEDAGRLAVDLPRAFECEENRQRFWDDVPCVLERDRYRLRMHAVGRGDVTEIDSYAELCEIDPRYCVS